MRAWRGNERLWVVWWIYGGGIVVLLATLVWLAPDPDSGRDLTQVITQGLFITTIGLLMEAIVIFWAVTVWRCAPNVANVMWTLITRASVVALFVGSVAYVVFD